MKTSELPPPAAVQTLSRDLTRGPGVLYRTEAEPANSSGNIRCSAPSCSEPLLQEERDRGRGAGRGADSRIQPGERWAGKRLPRGNGGVFSCRGRCEVWAAQRSELAGVQAGTSR